MTPFIPQDLPINSLNFTQLAKFIGEANCKIARYSGLLEAIPNMSVFIAPMTIQEAVISSKIEGTQASFSEIFKSEAGEKYTSHKSADIQEVINYKNTIFAAEKMFETRPFIHLNMIKKLHEILLAGVRGENKSPGQFRTIQNYIGPYGCKIEEATYIPPSPYKMGAALDNFEKFLNDDDFEPLVQLAQVHAQFELIHPFLDGNGRIGRILIPLFLQQKHYLKRPVFYLSEYFENNRDLYYQKLNQISQVGDWNGWVEFFLKAISFQAELNQQKVLRMIDLYDSMKQSFIQITKSSFAIKILDLLFKEPVIKSVDLIQKSGINPRSGRALLKKLIESGTISVYKANAGPQSQILSFSKLVNLIEN